MCEETYTLNDALPPGRGEYSVGQTITFMENGAQQTGEIIHVAAPGQTVSGKHHPTTYLVAKAEEGFPSFVYQTDIIEIEPGA